MNAREQARVIVIAALPVDDTPTAFKVADQISDKWESQLKDLQDRIQYVIDYMNSNRLLEDGCFTFPDGVTYWASGLEPRPKLLRTHITVVDMDESELERVPMVEYVEDDEDDWLPCPGLCLHRQCEAWHAGNEATWD